MSYEVRQINIHGATAAEVFESALEWLTTHDQVTVLDVAWHTFHDDEQTTEPLEMAIYYYPEAPLEPPGAPLAAGQVARRGIAGPAGQRPGESN